MEAQEEMKLLGKEIKKLEDAIYIRDLYAKRVEQDKTLLEEMKARMIKLEVEVSKTEDLVKTEEASKTESAAAGPVEKIAPINQSTSQ